MNTVRLVVFLAGGGALAAGGLIALSLVLGGRSRPTASSMGAVGTCIAFGVLGVLIGAFEVRVLTDRDANTDSRAAIDRPQIRSGEWQVGDARVGPLATVQAARLAAAETNVSLALAIQCSNGTVDEVAIGFANPPPSIWVHGGFYLSIDDGAIRSNRSNHWSGHRDREPEALDGPRVLERLAGSARLAVDVSQFGDAGSPTMMRATFDGSELASTLDRMACRLP